MDSPSSPTVPTVPIDPRLEEIASQITAIRSANKFIAHKVFITLLALLLGVIYIYSIEYFELIEQSKKQHKFIFLIVLLIALVLVQLIGIGAVLYEHLILILVFDIITKTTLITINPLVLVQCILLNNYIKELDKIHKLKYKK